MLLWMTDPGPTGKLKSTSSPFTRTGLIVRLWAADCANQTCADEVEPAKVPAWRPKMRTSRRRLGRSEQRGGRVLRGQQAPRTGKTQLDLWADQLADYVMQGVAWLKAQDHDQGADGSPGHRLWRSHPGIGYRRFRPAGHQPRAHLGRLCPDRAAGPAHLAGYVTVGGLFFIVGAFLLLWKGSGEE